MSKLCAKCDKPVYPLEELKCLDKIWHKGCFKCWECGMTLNMKNYKGFDRKPYCSAHYPQTKHTVVADTPELQRLSQTSKIQSQTAYHDAFEKSRGKYTSIADDPELLRLVKNQGNVSMAKYHEDFEKNIKGSKIQVADDPETQRLKQLSSVVSQVEYKGHREKVCEMEARRQNVGQSETIASRPDGRLNNKFLADDNVQNKPSPYAERSQSHSTTYSSVGKVETQQQCKIGSIADYDPTNFSATMTHSLANQTQEWEETVPMAPPSTQPLPSRLSQTTPIKVEPSEERLDPSVVAFDGVVRSPSALVEQPVEPKLEPTDQQYLVQQKQPQFVAPEPVASITPARSVGPAYGKLPNGAVFKAMYDYSAQDTDEVGFVEEDFIINCEPIDEGWMFGTVQRTGQRGMLPSNYVERVQ